MYHFIIHNMHNILLVCEIIIGLFGIISTIAAEDWHDRVHSIFVVFLALEGMISYILGGEHPLTDVMLILITITAIILAVLSIKPAVNHLKKMFAKKKKAEQGVDSVLQNDGGIAVQDVAITNDAQPENENQAQSVSEQVASLNE